MIKCHRVLAFKMKEIEPYQPKKPTTCGDLCERLVKECAAQGLRSVVEFSVLGNPCGHIIYSGRWFFKKEVAYILHMDGWNPGDPDSLQIHLYSKNFEELMRRFAREWEVAYPGCQAYLNKLYS